MSGAHRSSYVTMLQLQDDGRARIDCPLKGVMAIARCREFQRDTAAEGRSCRCSVYEAYRGGEANEKIDPSLNEELCGRELTDSLDEELAEEQQRRRPKGEQRRREDIPVAPGARSIDAQIADLQTSNRRPLRAIAVEEEGNEMANHARQASRCGECGRPSPEGTKVFGGLCKPCRDKKSARKQPSEKTLEKIVEKHAPPTSFLAPAPSSPTPAPPTIASVLDSPKERQQLMQPVVQADFDRLTREVKGLVRALNKATWIAQGVREGFIPIERLVEIEHARSAIDKAQS